MPERAVEMQKATGSEFLARLAASLLLALIVVGIVRFGVTYAGLDRLWKDILARPGGPMTFRFILQPLMAAIAALRDGVEDARLGRMPYLWVVATTGEQRVRLLWEAIAATAKILIFAMLMDIAYQWIVLNAFYPVQTAVVALLLAFVPYVLLRGPTRRVAQHWIGSKSPR
jgi:hypothetical protein